MIRSLAAVALLGALLSQGCSKDDDDASYHVQDTLTWSPNSEADLAGYRIYRATSTSGPWYLVATVGKTATSATLNSPDGAPAYHYTLRAFDSTGNESPASAPALAQ